MSINEDHFRKLERMYNEGANINRFFQPTVKISEGRAEVVLQVDPKFFHAAGAIHGAVYFKSLDDSAFFAANSLVEDVFVLTMSFNIYLLRPVSEGKLIAVGKVFRAGANVIFAESEMFDEQERVVARGSGTFAKSKVKLTPEIGYK